MTTIILDLEMNMAKEREIVEIAAVKLNEKNEIIEEFSSYVRPTKYEITKGTTKLTGITQSMVNRFSELEVVLIEFMKWLGEDYSVIYSWSMTDYDQLNEECIEKRIDSDALKRVFAKWEDYQREFGDLINYEGQLSLKNAIKAIDCEFEGSHHSALDDARNTATLYEVAHDIHKKAKLDVIKEWFAPKEILSTIGELFPQLISNLA